MDDLSFMRRAIALADASVTGNRGGPFGAVVVRDGAIIGEGANRVTDTLDPTAHAEIVAIRKACRQLGTFSLAGGTIYTSCEPCPMCLAAIYWARLERIVFGNSAADAAGIGFDDHEIYREIATTPECRSIPASRLLADEAIATFRAWECSTGKTHY